MKKPLISIVIPTFNRSKSLKRAIKSVLNQSYKNWELIIVDNSSTDDSLSMISNYKDKKIQVYSVENNGVIAYSRNIGILKSHGEYIAFLDSDDWWKNTKLESSLNTLTINNADIVYHNCKFITTNSKSNSNCRILKKNTLNDLIVNGNTLITSSVFVNKKALLEVGCFSENQEHIGWEDYHLWLKLAEKSYKFSMLRAFDVNCFQGDDNFDNPDRILINLKHIENFLIKSFPGICMSNFVWWLNYTRGKAYLKTNNPKEAKKELNHVIFGHSPMQYKIKSLYYRFIYNLKTKK